LTAALTSWNSTTTTTNITFITNITFCWTSPAWRRAHWGRARCLGWTTRTSRTATWAATHTWRRRSHMGRWRATATAICFCNIRQPIYHLLVLKAWPGRKAEHAFWFPGLRPIIVRFRSMFDPKDSRHLFLVWEFVLPAILSFYAVRTTGP